MFILILALLTLHKLHAQLLAWRCVVFFTVILFSTIFHVPTNYTYIWKKSDSVKSTWLLLGSPYPFFPLWILISYFSLNNFFFHNYSLSDKNLKCESDGGHLALMSTSRQFCKWSIKGLNKNKETDHDNDSTTQTGSCFI